MLTYRREAHILNVFTVLFVWKEAELEVEKQQQVALLHELEEQKAELEQMLQEAQREREQLRAAAQQEALLLQPQVPVQDRSPISLTYEEEVGPACLNRMLVELLQHIPLNI